MEEIKKLKMMLEGKMPITSQGLLGTLGTTPTGGDVVYQERVVYKQGDNKENNAMLE